MTNLKQRIERLEQKIMPQEDSIVKFRVIIHSREKPEGEYNICTMHENCYTYSYIFGSEEDENES